MSPTEKIRIFSSNGRQALRTADMILYRFDPQHRSCANSQRERPQPIRRDRRGPARGLYRLRRKQVRTRTHARVRGYTHPTHAQTHPFSESLAGS